jgi:hypothetical protein
MGCAFRAGEDFETARAAWVLVILQGNERWVHCNVEDHDLPRADRHSGKRPTPPDDQSLLHTVAT